MIASADSPMSSHESVSKSRGGGDRTEAKAGGVGLSRLWRDVQANIDRPRLFSWEDLSGWRWGPAVNDPTPGIIIDPGPVIDDCLTCREPTPMPGVGKKPIRQHGTTRRNRPIMMRG